MKEGEVTSCQTSDVLYFSHLLRQKHVVLRHGQVVRAQKWNLEIVLLHYIFITTKSNFMPVPQSAGQSSPTSLGSWVELLWSIIL